MDWAKLPSLGSNIFMPVGLHIQERQLIKKLGMLCGFSRCNKLFCKQVHDPV